MKRKQKRTIGRKISNADWLKFKPYTSFTGYDRYYVDRATEVLKIIERKKASFNNAEINKEDLKKLAIMLTSHFEDFINDIGIWSYFQKTNQALYGYPLPIYSLEEYDTDYLNPQDFTYLIWHFLCKTTNRLFAPDFPVILEMGNEIYDLLEEKIDEAPVTGFYDAFFDIKDDIHFFELKTRLKWFTFQSYALGGEFQIGIQKNVEEFLEDRDIPREQIGSYIYALEEDFIYKHRSGFSALSTLEWFAGVAQASEDTKAAILHLGQRVMSQFLYEKEDKDNWYYKEIYTFRIFPIKRESVNITSEARKERMAQLLSIVNWKGDWWVTGAALGYPRPSDAKIRDQRKDFASTPYYAYSEDIQASLVEQVAESERLFNIYYKGPIAFFDDKSALQKSMRDFNAYFNKNSRLRKLSDEEIEKIEAEKVNPTLDDFDFDDSKSLALIFLPKLGNVIDSNMSKVISLIRLTAKG
jgi:hypothetical protein